MITWYTGRALASASSVIKLWHTHRHVQKSMKWWPSRIAALLSEFPAPIPIALSPCESYLAESLNEPFWYPELFWALKYCIAACDCWPCKENTVFWKQIMSVDYPTFEITSCIRNLISIQHLSNKLSIMPQRCSSFALWYCTLCSPLLSVSGLHMDQGEIWWGCVERRDFNVFFWACCWICWSKVSYKHCSQRSLSWKRKQRKYILP